MVNERRTQQGARRDGRSPRMNFDRETRDRRDSQYFDGTCHRCGCAVRVPFKPSPERELLCKDCLHATRRPSGDAHESHLHGDGQTYDIVCSHCGKHDTVPFRPFEGSAVLCHECMENPNVERVRGKVLHTIICAVCGKENKVPFKPDPGSRVLCRECHNAEREQKAESRAYYAKHHPNVIHGTKVRVDVRCERCGNTDTLPFVPKTNGQILCRQCAENLFGEDWAKRNRLSTKEYPFTCSRCGVQDFLPFSPKKLDKPLLCRHCLNDQAVLSKHSRSEMVRHDSGICIRAHKGEADATPQDSSVLPTT